MTLEKTSFIHLSSASHDIEDNFSLGALRQIRLKLFYGGEMFRERYIIYFFVIFSIAFSSNTYADRATDILVKAAWNNDITLVKKLLSKNVNVNTKNKYGTTALMAAAQNGNISLAKLLIENGADIDIKNNHGRSALMLADYSSIMTIKLLLENGADVDLKNNYGATTLMLVAGSFDNYFEVVKLLIHFGADVNARDDEGKTAITYAMENNPNNKMDIIELLRKK